MKASCHNTKNTLFFFFFFFVSFYGYAQYIQVQDNYTPQQLVEDIFIGETNSNCVTVSNVSISGYTFGGNNKSYGYFDRNGSSFALDRGIILTTGKAVAAIGPNSSILSDGPSSWAGDQDLEQAINLYNTLNATILEFDFTANLNQISFDYIFSSEQYLTSINSPNQCNYTDGFAFLIRKADGTEPYTNLAVIPETNIPVTVNSVRGEGVCPSANEQYFDSFNGYEHPTNYNGQTKILTAQTQIIPGETYHIKLVIADQGNNFYDSAVFLKAGSFGNSPKDLGPDRLVSQNNPLCEGETLLLDATTPNAVSYQWYKDQVLINQAQQPTYLVNETGTYEVVISLGEGNCPINGLIQVEYASNPVLNNTDLIQCDGVSDDLIFNLTIAESQLDTDDQDLTFTYFTNLSQAQNNQNPIADPVHFQGSSGQVIYVVATNPLGCSSIAQINLLTASNDLQPIDNLEACEELDGRAIFDLTENQEAIEAQIQQGMTYQFFVSMQDALTGQNPIVDLQNFTINTQQTIYVKLSENGNCYGILWFNLIIHRITADLSTVEDVVCQGEELLLTAPSGYYNYQWSNGALGQSLSVTDQGLYTVTFTDVFGCVGSKSYDISISSKATIVAIEINDLNLGANTIKVLAEGLGTYDYSLDGINYQSSPVFENVPAGEYMVFVRDPYCGITTDIILVVDYPRFFTPNLDGINDYWMIKGLWDKYPKASVFIFDRYGKLLYHFDSPQDLGWNGYFNSERLPATDYWFKIVLPHRIVRGHFSLIR